MQAALVAFGPGARAPRRYPPAASSRLVDDSSTKEEDEVRSTRRSGALAVVAFAVCLLVPGVAPAAQKVGADPDITALPGGATLQGLVNGVAAFAGLACLVGLLLGAGLWALGSHAQNYHQSSTGKKTVLTSIATALLVGGAVGIINFFLATGDGIK